MLKPEHLLRGEQAEQQALDFLLKHDLELIERNFRCRYGEIDLIMQDKNTLVFVEVRYRKNATYGSPLESVNLRKQAKLIATTEFYLAQKQLDVEMRFDVIGLTSKKLEWIKDAF